MHNVYVIVLLARVQSANVLAPPTQYAHPYSPVRNPCFGFRVRPSPLDVHSLLIRPRGSSSIPNAVIRDKADRERVIVDNANVQQQIAELETLIANLTDGQGMRARIAAAKIQEASVAATCAFANTVLANSTSKWVEEMSATYMSAINGKNMSTAEQASADRAAAVLATAQAAASAARVAKAEAKRAEETIQKAAASILQAAKRAERARIRLAEAQLSQAQGWSRLSRWDSMSIKDAAYQEAELPRIAKKAEIKMTIAADRLAVAMEQASVALKRAEDAAEGKNIDITIDPAVALAAEKAAEEAARQQRSFWPWLLRILENILGIRYAPRSGKEWFLAQAYIDIRVPTAAVLGFFAGGAFALAVFHLRWRHQCGSGL